MLPADAVEVISSCDEIDAMATLGTKQEVRRMVDKLIKRLEHVLAEVGDAGWDVDWRLEES